MDLRDEVRAVVDGEWKCSLHWSEDYDLRMRQMKRDLINRLIELELKAHSARTLLVSEDFRWVYPAGPGE